MCSLLCLGGDTVTRFAYRHEFDRRALYAALEGRRWTTPALFTRFAVAAAIDLLENDYTIPDVLNVVHGGGRWQPDCHPDPLWRLDRKRDQVVYLRPINWSSRP